MADGSTIFQFGPYDGENVLYLTSNSPSGSLVFSEPATYKSLSILAASAQGGGAGSMVIHFGDGSSSAPISFDASLYLTGGSPASDAAIANFGALASGGPFPSFGTLDNYQLPISVFYQTPVDLHGLGLDSNVIDSISFTIPANTGSTGIFAVSGTAIPFNGNYNLNVVASPLIGGSVTGGGSYPAGTTNTVTATPDEGYVFGNWTVNGNVVSASTNYTFALNGNETVVANFLTHFTVTTGVSPASGGSVTGGGLFLQESSIQLNAVTNGGYEFLGWSGDVGGTNNPLTVVVTRNLDITANFATPSGNILWTVVTNVPVYGSVKPNLNEKSLVAGKNYTLTATPSPGNIFVNWTGSITTNKNPLTLKATGDMLIQANFIPNPFLSIAGAYNGLFQMSSGVTLAAAGMVKGLSITSKGAYSGSLVFGGAAHPISGSFNAAGEATNIIKRTVAQGGAITVVLTAAASPEPQITGTVTGNFGASYLTAYRGTNAFGSGAYTMLIGPDYGNSPPVGSPGGDGCVAIADKTGAATLTGALADGTALSQTVTVSQDGYVPVYDSLYGGKGMLFGWVNLSSTNTGGVGLAWIHPSAKSGLYKNGFTNTISANQITIASWAQSLGVPAAVSLLDTIGDSIAVTNEAVNISTAGKISGNGVTGAIAPKTGIFSVTLKSGKSKIVGRGAMINATNGGGFFLTTSNAQAVKIGF
jgi:hypothetical protein